MPRAGRAAGCAAALFCAAGTPAARAQIGFAPALTGPDQRVVDFVREGAMRRLQSHECRKLLTDFRDASGRPLAERLALYALPPEAYLAQLVFVEGREHRSCRDGSAEMVTAPGFARVLVCPSFLRTLWRNRTRAEVYVIHEMLHTLGLGEDPPTSREITEQVERRCAP